MSTCDTDKHSCLAEDVAAYLDAELEDRARELFEQHVKDCRQCATELLEQRQLLCALAVAFNEKHAMNLPRNFAQIVATHAESDMGGMRDRSERRQALKLSLVLAAASYALIGAASGELVWGPARALAGHLQSFFNFLWDAAYQASAGPAVIFRMLTRSFVFESRLLGFFILLLFVTAVTLLPRLIAQYHRTQIIE